MLYHIPATEARTIIENPNSSDAMDANLEDFNSLFSADLSLRMKIDSFDNNVDIDIDFFLILKLELFPFQFSLKGRDSSNPSE